MSVFQTIVSQFVYVHINMRLECCTSITTSVLAITGTINYIGNLFVLLLE